jgi:hypothetical protein
MAAQKAPAMKNAAFYRVSLHNKPSLCRLKKPDAFRFG